MRRPGRPQDAVKGLAILDAGWALFLGRGVDGTSMEAVATAAGVSKVTLYRHYPDKAALFEATVRREIERIEQAQRDAGAGGPALPVAAQLRGFGMGIMRFLASKPAVDFYSVVAGELRRHEALARAFYDLGPGRTRANLAVLIAAATARGALAAPDPERAAEELFGMWQGFSNFQLALGIDVEGLHAGLEARVDQAVAVFMQVYGSR